MHYVLKEVDWWGITTMSRKKEQDRKSERVRECLVEADEAYRGKNEAKRLIKYALEIKQE